jgi:hypothetical protein
MPEASCLTYLISTTVCILSGHVEYDPPDISLLPDTGKTPKDLDEMFGIGIPWPLEHNAYAAGFMYV